MNKGLLFWLCLLVLSSSLTSAALPAGRVALVIGNANYPDARTPLSATIKDARTLADEFRRIDFDVDFKENLNKQNMQNAITAFTGKITNGTVALLYFSGFGLEVGRQTYLIPVNAQIWAEADVRRDGISVDAVLADMHRAGAKVKIIILDAARRNPFERRFRATAAGLAPVDAPVGTLVLYSAAPGQVLDESSGANSLFVGELIKELRSPNLTAEDIFKRARIGVSRASNNEQVPWVTSSLVEEFYFRPSNTVVTTPAPAPSSPPQPPPPSPGTSTASRSSPTVSTTPPREPPRSGSKPGDIFRDCPDCPEMVVVPAGSFAMGSSSEYEKPVHRVNIAKNFAVGRREVTFNEWDKCVDDGGCKYRPQDRGWGRGDRPVINVSWLDAKEFVVWMSRKTGQVYRLPSEAEWEYAARAGTDTPFWWGGAAGSRQANCRECNTGQPEQTLPVGTFQPNRFGLYDTAGNAAEWVEDCWNDNYVGGPTDGSAWASGQCRLRVLRGGSFDSAPTYARSMARFRYDFDVRYYANGFRVVRELQ
jgi:formylglycine-generating enzyme required for sulfatase activity